MGRCITGPRIGTCRLSGGSRFFVLERYKVGLALLSVNAGDDTVDGVWIGGCGYLESLKTIEVE